MEHRSGFIDGEGDGCGILCDIPRTLWAQKLLASGKPGELAFDKRFAVGHIFIPRNLDRDAVMADIRARMADAGFTVLHEEVDNVNPGVLGKNARKESPTFWQVALLAENVDTGRSLEAALFELHVAIEAAHNVHVASLSNHTVAYKVMGAAGILPQYFADIGRPEFQSTVTIGHNRYSTNTLSNFFRVQPFTLLGHNGEINTITRLEEEAEMLGVPLVAGGSDSQNLNRTAEALIHRYNLTLFEAMEFLFPPILNEIKQLRPELQDLYAYIREAWGHFAQGPAGIVSRYKDECVFSVDAWACARCGWWRTSAPCTSPRSRGSSRQRRWWPNPSPLPPAKRWASSCFRKAASAGTPTTSCRRRCGGAWRKRWTFAGSAIASSSDSPRRTWRYGSRSPR